MEIEYGTRKGIHGEYQAWFKIGVQIFYLQENGDKKHAEWYVEILKQAFEKLQEKEVGNE
jgi:hypothetical protein